MINRVILITLAFVCIHVCGAVEPDYFMGEYSSPKWGHMSSGFPDGVHARDISPDKIRIEHITPLLDFYEKNLRKGTLRQALTRQTRGILYITSFVGDERFSSIIYDQYAERLFEEFGDKEATVVLLYYRTGGSLEKLRALYQQPIDNVVKKAIEVCFFDASTGLLDEEEQDAAVDATPQPLSVTLSTKFRTRKYYSKALAGEIPDDLFGSPTIGGPAGGGRYLQEHTTDKRDLFITYENTTENRLIQIEIPRRKSGDCWCGLKTSRDGGVPVLASGYLVTHEHEKQLITLYPGDQYIRKMDVNFSTTIPGVLMSQLFSDFGKEVVRLGDYWVGNAADDFRVTLNYTCNFIAAESVEDLKQIVESDWKVVRSSPLDLDYVHDSAPRSTKTSKERAWESIMTRWKDIP